MEKIKIILIDNDPDELFFMELGFGSSERYEIIAQFSSGQGLQTFLRQSNKLPDLIITDLNMPGKNGIDIASEISANPAYASIKVIILSLIPEYGVALKHSLTGTCLFFQKPPSLLGYKSFAVDLYEKIYAALL